MNRLSHFPESKGSGEEVDAVGESIDRDYNPTISPAITDVRSRPLGSGTDMPNHFTRGHALVIGVANYPSLSKLPNTLLADARSVSDLLLSPEFCAYPIQNVELQLDVQATRESIRAGLERLARAAGEDDTVVVYFSGHGGRVESGPDAGAYLLPFDCDPNQLRETAISSSELTDSWRGSRPAASSSCSMPVTRPGPGR